MKTLIDTCVAIDFMRGFTPAVAFFNSLENQPYMSCITVAELYAGAKTARKKQLVTEVIQNCIVLDIDQSIAESCQYTPSHGVDLPDALIAATAKIHQLALATCNVKHFPMIEGLQRPYSSQ